MKIKITEKQLEAIIDEARNHVTWRSKKIRAGKGKKKQTGDPTGVIREEKVNEEHDCATVHPDTSHDEWAQLNEEEQLTEEFYQYIKENNIVEEDVNEELFNEWFVNLE